jgi:predicted SprT family Zn-dependent metalloprotease
MPLMLKVNIRFNSDTLLKLRDDNMRKFVKKDNSHVIIFNNDDDKEAIKKYEEDDNYLEMFEFY